MQRLRSQHVTALLVAAACVILALSNGGFEPGEFGAGALAAWALVLVALAMGLVPRAEPPKPAVVAGLCLAGLAALAALSMLWGSDNGHAYDDVVRTLFYLGVFVLVVLAANRGDAVSWLAGLAIGLVAVAVLALGGRFEPSWFGYPDAQVVDQLPAAAGRLTYPVGYWNGLAAAMATALTLLAWLAARSRTVISRTLATAAMPTVLLAMWMTGSRGGLVAAALGIAVLLGFARRRTAIVAGLGLGTVAGAIAIVIVEGYSELQHDPLSAASASQGDKMLLILLALTAVTGLGRWFLDAHIERLSLPERVGRGALVALVIALLATVALSDPVERWNDFKELPTGQENGNGISQLRIGGSGRYQFWEQALDAFASKPIAGVGAAGYTPYWLEHRDVAIPATRAHSLLFETMAELGAIGLALLLGFFGAAAVAGVRRARDRLTDGAGAALGVLTGGFAASTVDWTWDLPAVFGATVVAAALLTGPATLAPLSDAKATAGGTARSRRRFAAGVGILVIGWVSVCAAGLLLLSDQRLAASRDAFDRGDLQEAADAADAAATIEPWAAEPHVQLALVRERSDQIAQAREEIEKAIDRAPRDYKLYLLASRIALAAGDDAAADAYFERATELNPRDETLAELVASE
jgi:O-antigen ligase